MARGCASGGDVAAGSIQHEEGKALFTLKQDGRTL
jgi:hypothetical protein